MSSDYSNISEFFSHPLVLLLIGALISGVFIPYFTNRAAKYQKGLEIKTDLVRRINESVMPMVTSLYSLLEEYSYWTGGSGIYFRKKGVEDQLEEIKEELDQVELEESRKKILEQKQKEVPQDLQIYVKSIHNIENPFGHDSNLHWKSFSSYHQCS